MGCINVSVQRIGKNLNISTNKISESPIISVEDITERFTVDCSILCDIISMLYLYVNPDILWINETNISQFDIISNVKWEIK